jgi:RNA polymerase sigma-70 factor (ECF subfamily)
MKAQHLGQDDRKRATELTALPAVRDEEHKLVAAAKDGDSIAFDILCMQSSCMAFNVARRIMRTAEDAEDAVQESFQLAFVHLNKFKGDSRFSTWLTRIVTNAALMRLRKNNGRRELSLEETFEFQPRSLPLHVEDQSLNPEQLCAQAERHWLVCKAVAELSPGMRRVVELRELDERSTQETARIMGVSVCAVKARMFHARRKLRRILISMHPKSIRGGERRRMNPKPNGTFGPQAAYNAGD